MNIDIWFKDLLEEIMFRGQDVESRSGKVRSVFSPKEFVSEPLWMGNFPIWSTKKCLFSKPCREGLFFLTGSTKVKDMPEDIRNTWWKPWTKNEEDLGKFYGYQLRHREGHFDQITWLENNIIDYPHSRRHVISAFNNVDIEKACLPACHMVTWQFYIRGVELDMFAYGRSSDVTIGLPHNIIWAAQFLILLANSTGYAPGILKYKTGDAHIYKSHFDQVDEILNQEIIESKPKWRLKNNYLNLGIDEILVRAEQNCLDKKYGFECPLILEDYKPQLKNLKFKLES